MELDEDLIWLSLCTGWPETLTANPTFLSLISASFNYFEQMGTGRDKE
jgi:hypothetical protein